MTKCVAIAVAVLAMSACGKASPSLSKCLSPQDKGAVVVFAASSLKNVLNEIKPKYLEAYPCTTSLTFNFGSSATLATQIVSGSPADVFMTASTKSIDAVSAAGKTTGRSQSFARNSGELMVAAKSEFAIQIKSLADVFSSQPKIQVGLCVASAPCGSLADDILTNARVVYANNKIARSNIDSEASSVEDLVTKIELDELDAGIVYHSDCVWAQQQKKASCIALPATVNGNPLNVSNPYWVATVSKNFQASEFVKYVNSPEFTTELQSTYGFLAP